MKNFVRGATAASIAAALLAPAGPAAAVVEGQESTAGQWPSVVSISWMNEPACTGTVVAPTWVLSSASCLGFEGGQPPAEEFSVTAGAVDLTDGTSGESRGLSEIVIHPGFDFQTGMNDLALARLDAAVSVPSQLLATATPAEGTAATLAGFGITGYDDSGLPSRLRHVDISLVSDGTCAQRVEGFPYDTARMLCAGAVGSSSNPSPGACFGDEGGPLLALTQDGSPRPQIGVLSFHNCGEQIGSYFTEVAQYRSWIDGILAGGSTDAPDPENPAPIRGAATEIVRVHDDARTTTEGISQAVAVSQHVFESDGAMHAVLARVDVFADALTGSILARYGPLLFTGSDGALASETATELRRVLNPDSIVYVLGGPAAIPTSVDDDIRELGFLPIRLAGANREETAIAIADEYIAERGPVSEIALATSGNWPDAVTAGQLNAFWGVPVLLTPPGALHPATSEALGRLRPDELLVLGGTAAISETVANAAREVSRARAIRLAGPDRMGTAAAILEHHVARSGDFGFLETAVVVNLRQDFAWTQVLSAAPLVQNYGVYVPVEGLEGDTLAPAVERAACGLDLEVVVAGGRDVVSTAGASAVQRSLLGEEC